MDKTQIKYLICLPFIIHLLLYLVLINLSIKNLIG